MAATIRRSAAGTYTNIYAIEARTLNIQELNSYEASTQTSESAGFLQPRRIFDCRRGSSRPILPRKVRFRTRLSGLEYGVTAGRRGTTRLLMTFVGSNSLS